jgi:hypothetical protein
MDSDHVVLSALPVEEIEALLHDSQRGNTSADKGET